MRKQHVFLVSFEFHRDSLQAVGNLPFKSREKAIERAEALAGQYAGVGVYAVWVDDVTCDPSDLQQVAVFGEVPDLDAMSQAA